MTGILVGAIAGWAIAYMLQQSQPFLILAMGRAQFTLLALNWMIRLALIIIAFQAIIHPFYALETITRLVVLMTSFVFTMLFSEGN